MAHTYVGFKRFVISAAASTTTITYTAATGTTLICAAIATTGATSRSGTLVYSGISMSKVAARAATESNVELWYVQDPPAGVSLVTIPINSVNLRVTLIEAAASFGHTSAIDAFTSSVSTAASPICSIKPTIPGDFIVQVIGDGNGSLPAANSHTLIQRALNSTWWDGEQYTIATGTAVVSLSWTNSSDDWCVIAAAFKEVDKLVIISAVASQVNSMTGVLVPPPTVTTQAVTDIA